MDVLEVCEVVVKGVVVDCVVVLIRVVDGWGVVVENSRVVDLIVVPAAATDVVFLGALVEVPTAAALVVVNQLLSMPRRR